MGQHERHPVCDTLHLPNNTASSEPDTSQATIRSEESLYATKSPRPIRTDPGLIFWTAFFAMQSKFKGKSQITVLAYQSSIPAFCIPAFCMPASRIPACQNRRNLPKPAKLPKPTKPAEPAKTGKTGESPFPLPSRLCLLLLALTCLPSAPLWSEYHQPACRGWQAQSPDQRT